MSLAPGLETSRIVTGLWQMADQERGGAGPDLDAAAEALAAYARAGFTGWDMADHYGSAEIVAGRARALLAAEGGLAPMIATKWCPEPGPMTPETVRAGVERALRRLKTDHIPLLQLHWWRYEHPGYLDAAAELMRLRAAGLIGELGVTNVDAAHLRVLVKNGV
ncbi:MAG: aldo/keto reductase, partial [Pseudomonadota bacterium]